MTNLAKTGIGATLSVGDGATPEVFTAIGEIVGISGPNLETKLVDATTLDSNGVEQQIPGLRNYGSLDFEMLFIKAALQTQFRADTEGGTQRNYRLSLPTSPATTATFVGLPMKFGMTVNPNDPMKAACGLKINSSITWT
jgi:hypothetical protein